MKLQDFLSTKAKCIKELDPRYFNSWDVGETYDISITIQVTDKNNDDICFEPQDFLDHFEPVLDDMPKPQDEIDTVASTDDLHPEFEALNKPQPDWSTAPDGFDWWAKDKDGTAYWFDDLPRKQGDCWGGPCNFEKTTINLNDKPWHESLERRPKVDAITATNDLDSAPMGTRTVSEPQFKVGDKFYYGMGGVIFVASEVFENRLKDKNGTTFDIKYCCLATQENYERLQATFPDINFEAPPKLLTGSDLCRAMLDKGWVSVPCYISDESDYEADNNAFCALIGKFDKCFKELATNYEHEYAVPFDPRTGEVLTEAVLDE